MPDLPLRLRRRATPLSLLLAAILLAGCQGLPRQAGSSTDQRLEVFAESEHQWTGVAVSHDERVFVNFPLWGESVPFAVAEILRDGALVPYPGPGINQWAPGKPVADNLVCVQSVWVDDDAFLWILDTGNPRFAGVIDGAPKLLRVDLYRDRTVQSIHFEEPVVKPGSYLNDVRVDTRHDVAYITDSGDGALIVVDLTTNEARRLLDNHPATASDGAPVVIDGQTWTRGGDPGEANRPAGGDGTEAPAAAEETAGTPAPELPDVHADGIALSPGGEWLYFKTLTGTGLWRVRTAFLRDGQMSAGHLGETVEFVRRVGVADGMACDADGWVYITDLDDKAITRTRPFEPLQTVTRDERIQWPDSISFGPRGDLYFTLSRIHEGASPKGSYKIFRLPAEARSGAAETPAAPAQPPPAS